MRKLVFAAFAVSVAGAIAMAFPRARQDRHPATGVNSTPIPILVELFTSEGCSSCPPADEVLTKLVADQPVAGAHVIALGEHVDYWNRLGWRDPFSSGVFSNRQAQYSGGGLLHLSGIYTPQMIVDGRQEFVGSDYRAATAAIAKAVASNVMRLPVSLALSQPSDGSIHVTVRVDPSVGSTPQRSSDVWLSVTEDGLQSRVERGENNGHTLHHTAVARILTRLGAIAPGQSSWSTTRSVAIAADWAPQALQLVAFVQDASSLQVLGAAALRP